MKTRAHWLLVFLASAAICCLILYGSEKGPIVPPHPGDDHVITMPFPLQRLQQLAAQTNEVLRTNNYWLPR